MLRKTNYLAARTEAVKQFVAVKRKYRTVPDQSMTIQEIMARFVRGIPVDIQQRESVYVDQSEYDLEKMSRMDFGDKAAMAAEMREQSEAKKAAFEERQRVRKEVTQRAKAKKEQPEKPKDQANESSTPNES